MTDPRGGAPLIMERAMGGVGDYVVTGGRYGVRDGYLLRLECDTGRAIGIVPR